ncbi:hypothetical protein COT62_02680 [Candidatus Roizmanbacteria bacterium CG09_land_8_20_14_0_10_41_9]|uniref:Type II secretion system protein GspG C-terminal domain-containing protein n=1 Tax=Candidatus Roizmanbacteria bacterium CG09_land_8_20_14_0_10_41_9 TaxID=1974850 RepID=A0A2H0WUN0_9BACT|nr:MAG: hypothetical protein COT62_02680 [Candidatus Roizmanbacteria bacterium CG09_land_8_20_14_0_10_41_9]
MRVLRNRVLSELSFTLLELLVVIAILGVLAAMISGNFVTSMVKGRDAKRKSDLEHIQKALEMYYEDNRQYPPSIAAGGVLTGAGGKIYMQIIPPDPTSSFDYEYVVSGDRSSYQLYSCIENANDAGSGVDQDGYTGTSCCNGSPCKYGISSTNTTP